MVNLTHAHACVNAFFIWAYQCSISNRKWTVRATGFQPPACFYWKNAPTPNAELSTDTYVSAAWSYSGNVMGAITVALF